MRTFDRATYLEAQESWKDFDWEWEAIRRVAYEAGFIYAPEGTKWDDRAAESPTQRAIVWRALQDNPTKLTAIVRRSHSWGQVVSGIIGMEASLREDANDLARDTAWSRQDEPDHRQSTMALKSILTRLGDS